MFGSISYFCSASQLKWGADHYTITQRPDKSPPPSAQQTCRHAARMSVSSKATVMSFRSRRGLRHPIGPGQGVMAVWCVKAIRCISVQMVWSNAVLNIRSGHHPGWVIYDDLLISGSFRSSAGFSLDLESNRKPQVVVQRSRLWENWNTKGWRRSGISLRHQSPDDEGDWALSLLGLNRVSQIRPRLGISKSYAVLRGLYEYSN